MARETKKLSARAVATLTEPGRHSDGGGLYLVVDESGAKRWLLMFRMGEKRKEMGLGSVGLVSLAEARDKATAARKLVSEGINPIEQRKGQKIARMGRVKFGEFADDYIKGVLPGFRSLSHQKQWSRYFPQKMASLWDMYPDEITTEHVVAALKPIWHLRRNTMVQRGRLERVLDAAKSMGLRSGDNPARWRGHLENLMPKAPATYVKTNFPAMPFDLIPAFVAQLRERHTASALVLEFIILTASRTAEARGMTWSEFDEEQRLWTIPRERMKNFLQHRVPLSERAMEIISIVKKIGWEDPTGGDFVFPSARRKFVISANAMQKLLQDSMGMKQYTVHGFRSSFRDWAGEATEYPREVAEAALSHQVGDLTERAYRRGDALERRRGMMEAWARYVGSQAEPIATNVVPLRSRYGGGGAAA